MLYKKSGRPIRLLQIQAENMSAQILSELSSVPKATIPTTPFSESDLFQLTEILFCIPPKETFSQHTALPIPQSTKSKDTYPYKDESDIGNRGNESTSPSDKESRTLSSDSDAKTDRCFSSDDTMRLLNHSSSDCSSNTSSRTASPHFFQSPKTSPRPTASPSDKKPSQEKNKSGIHTITLSEYRKITGLRVPVSSNFGIVVPDEPTVGGEKNSYFKQ